MNRLSTVVIFVACLVFISCNSELTAPEQENLHTSSRDSNEEGASGFGEVDRGSPNRGQFDSSNDRDGVNENTRRKNRRKRNNQPVDDNDDVDLSYPWGSDGIRDISKIDVSNPPVCRESSWFDKYLKYRLRVRGNDTAEYPGFVDVGKGSGMSLLANRRLPNAECSDSTREVRTDSCDIDNPEGGHGFYNWGDTTIILGTYIATLASEYRAFKLLGLDTSQTVHDLYYALEAFNRLDRKAEKAYEAARAENGFFLRKDIPPGFEKKDDGSYRFPRDDEYRGYGCTTSAKCRDLTVKKGDFMSQDQTMGMLFGLAFVSKFVNEDVEFNGTNLVKESKEITHRVTTYLKDNDWEIVDPDGNTPPENWGGNATGFSNQIAKAANFIVGDEFGVDDYRDTKSRTLGAGAIEGIAASWDVQNYNNRGMSSKIVPITDTWNKDRLARKLGDNLLYAYIYANAVLHDKKVSDKISNWQVESILSKAPCSGPCHKTEGCAEAPGWRGAFRWRSPQNRYGYRYGPKGEYSGIDYMLMHNLYLIYRQGDYQFQPQKDVSRPQNCSDFKSLGEIISGDVSEDDTYETFNKCGVPDMHRQFCGRSWSSWLKKAYEGQALIQTGQYYWSCDGDQPCQLDKEKPDNVPDASLVLGSQQNDNLEGTDGNDCIYGFGGDDTLVGAGGHDEIHGGEGDDDIQGDNSGLSLRGATDVLFGGPGDDKIQGGQGFDEILGGKGNDKLHGDSGRDYLEGGEGDDFLKGDAGAEHLSGGPGDDYIKGDSGSDVAWGESGNDKLKGDSGGDRLFGGPGDDFVKGDSGKDHLQGNKGTDRLCGDGGSDVLWGGWDYQGSKDECRAGSDFGSDIGLTDDEVHQCAKIVDYEACTTSTFEEW